MSHIEAMIASTFAAQAISSAQQPRWLYTMDIKGILASDGIASDADIIVKGQKIAEEIRRAVPADLLDINSEGYDEIIECLVCEFADMKGSVESSAVHTYCEEFDTLLASLYDWADANRMWIDSL